MLKSLIIMVGELVDLFFYFLLTEKIMFICGDL
jgi:hypothetical protein